MKFNKLKETAFEELQLNTGILLSSFDPVAGSFMNENIVGATSGGVNFSAVPTFSDYGSDIDNAPQNVLELKKLDRWEITMTGTFVTVNKQSAKMLIGAADDDNEDETHIVPRNDVVNEDFSDLWWVGDYSDKNGETKGGFLAIHMMNTLSTGGFSLQTTDRGKGTFAFTFTAHYSMTEQEKVPFEIFIKQGEDEVVEG